MGIPRPLARVFHTGRTRGINVCEETRVGDPSVGNASRDSTITNPMGEELANLAYRRYVLTRLI